MTDAYEDWFSDPDCSFCGGEGYEECDDFIQCCAPHHIGNGVYREHECKACGGSGLAKDQVIW